jgi:zinc transporter ZupT
MIMPKLHKIGLAVMLLGIIIAIGRVMAYPVLHTVSQRFYFDVYLFCITVLPAIIVTFVAWRWPIYGGFAGGALSVMALLYLLLWAINRSVEPSPDNFFIAITLCFTAGSVLILMATGVIPLAKRKKRKRMVS